MDLMKLGGEYVDPARVQMIQLGATLRVRTLSLAGMTHGNVAGEYPGEGVVLDESSKQRLIESGLVELCEGVYVRPDQVRCIKNQNGKASIFFDKEVLPSVFDCTVAHALSKLRGFLRIPTLDEGVCHLRPEQINTIEIEVRGSNDKRAFICNEGNFTTSIGQTDATTTSVAVEFLRKSLRFVALPGEDGEKKLINAEKICRIQPMGNNATVHLSDNSAYYVLKSAEQVAALRATALAGRRRG